MAKPTTKKKTRRPVLTYEPKGYELKRIFQKIAGVGLFENLDLDPKYLPWLYLDNVILRTFSRMIGQGPYGPIVAKCTKDGSLAVVSRGGAFDDYILKEWAFNAAGEVKELDLTRQVERIDIFTYDGKVNYQLTRDLVKAYGPAIELFEDSFYSLDFYTRKVKATCKAFTPKETGTATATSANHLVDAAATFVTNKVAIGDVVANITDQTYATVTAVNSETDLTISANIFVSGETYTIEGSRTKLMGWFRAEE